MVRKRKTLVNNFQEIIDSGDLDAFKSVFDKCEISATDRGATTCNALSYKRLTPAHIQFLIDNGFDINGDCGYGYSAVSHQAYQIDNLRCLIDNGADINLSLSRYNGNALANAASNINLTAIKNLLSCGAKVDVTCDFDDKSVLDTALSHCANTDIIKVLNISKLFLSAGVKTSASTKDYVHKIGEHFEFYRKDFNKKYVDEFSDALNELYKLFNVEPVARRLMYDGKSRIKVNSTTWQKQHTELWDMLVPGSGSAETVQGEMIRIIGKVLYEILDNGGINWDNQFNKMLSALIEYFHMTDNMDRTLIEEACSLAEHISPSSTEKVLYRLNELVVLWVLANPDPIQLGKVEYTR